MNPRPECHFEEGPAPAPALDDEPSFWLHASEPSARTVWENPEDDRYRELLEEGRPRP